MGCMSGHAGVLALPARGGRVTAAGQGRCGVENRPTGEAALVSRVQGGDEAAFRELVERYQNKVYSIIYGILRNHNDAEDIAQQVFTKVYFSIGNFDFRSSLLTWIYKITVNECYDYLRKRRVRKLVYESDLGDEEGVNMERSEPDTAPRIDEELERRDLALKLLDKVSPEDRQLMLLKEVEGHSVEELARMTGMNENTIKVKLFRARQKLVKAAQHLTQGKRLRPVIPKGSS